MERPLIVSVANQKGGVGKTTTAVNLAAALAERGVRTLLLDLDIQGSASAFLGATPADDATDVARVLLEDRALDEAVRPTQRPGLSIAAAGERMSLVDLHLASAFGRERALERVLKASSAVQSHDVVVIDTAPYLGLLTVNALVASDHVLVPVSCEYLPMLGLKLFGETLAKLRAQAGARATVLGYLLTLCDRRERISAEVEAMLRKRFGDEVFRTTIRMNTQHKSAPSHRKTIFEHEGPGGRGSEDYRALCSEVLERLGLSAKATTARKERVRQTRTTTRKERVADAG